MSKLLREEQVLALKRGAVLVVGDIMLDRYLIGDVERISPEAPVPVVNVQDETLFLGGAGNVAQNITALGGQAFLVGVAGVDAEADILAQKLDACNVRYALIALQNRPTTQKTRILARRQQMLRFDREIIKTVEAENLHKVLEKVEQFLPQVGAVIVSDYGKGLVSQNLMNEIKKLIEQERRDIPVLVDPKPQNLMLYSGATLLTPNTKETSEAAQLPASNKEEILEAGWKIMQILGLKHLVTTLGADGMAVFVNAHEVWHIPTAAREVFDVTGAGDTVIATTALGLSAGLSLLEACTLANISAGIVVGQVGTATAKAGQVAQMLEQQAHISPQRWI